MARITLSRTYLILTTPFDSKLSSSYRTAARHSPIQILGTSSLFKEADQSKLCSTLIWNQAACLKLIWMVFFQAGSIWVAWYRREVLQGNLNSYCLFWHDNWTPFGRLSKFLQGERLGIHSDVKVSELWSMTSGWLLPPARSDNQLQLLIYLSTISSGHEEDKYQWWIDDNSQDKHSTRVIYEALRLPQPPYEPAKIIWIRQGIPKHCFLSWLISLNRCSTRDRLINWGLTTDPLCLLCGSQAESRDHIFFACDYSWELWSTIAARSRFVSPRSWNSLIQALLNFHGNRNQTYLLLLSWQATLYSLWHERNQRLHHHSSKPTTLLYTQIDSTIRNKISTNQSQNPTRTSELRQLWFSTQPLC